MQTTLLGIGIAIILALVAALVGPHVVDWGAHRAAFEREASRLVGMPVGIGGPVDVRLLPTPGVTLRDVSIAGAEAASPRLSSPEVSVDFALGPLVRGEWRATDMRIVRPEIRLRLDRSGRLDWAAAAVPAADVLSIDRLAVEDATLVLADAASATQHRLDRLSFAGELRSLSGAARGEGGFTLGGAPYAYRLALSRRDGEDGVRLRLNVDAGAQPVGGELDGALTFDNGAPAFDGTFAWARSADVKLAQGQVVANEPWRASARLRATAQHALLERLEVVYGTEPRALRLAGDGRFAFGARPALAITLAARQADLDRLAAFPAGARRLPLATVAALAKPFDGAPPRFPVSVTLRADAATLGNGQLRNVRGVLAGSPDGWRLDGLEFGGPGGSSVRARGTLRSADRALAFAGPATVAASDSNAFAAWLEGRVDAGGRRLGPLRASGDVTLGGGRFAVERLSVDFDRKAMTGRLAYAAAGAKRAARLDLDLKAPDLDIDGTVALLRAALPEFSLSTPTEISLNADLAAATYAGVRARDLKVRLSLGADGLVIERASVGDLAGAAVDANGRVQGPWSSPRGILTVDLDGRDLGGVAALMRAVWPQSDGIMTALLPRLTPAKLQATLNFTAADGARGRGAMRGRVTGEANGVAVAADAAMQGDIVDPKSWDATIAAGLSAAAGGALLRLVGLEHAVAVAPGGATLRFDVRGRIGESVKVEGKLTAPGLRGEANGGILLYGENGPRGEGALSLEAADAVALRSLATGGGGAVPTALRASVRAEGGRIVLDGIDGKIGEGKISGRLTIAEGGRVDGQIALDALDATGLVAMLAGMPARASAPPLVPAAAGDWSTAPFAAPALAGWSGKVALSAARARLTRSLEMRPFKAALRLDGDAAALEGIDAGLGRGNLSGRLALRGSEAGLTALAELTLAGADLAALTAGGAPAPLAGALDLQLDAKGVGRTPAALAASLTGSGTVTVGDTAVSGLDPRAFDVAAQLAEQGEEIEGAKLKASVEAALGRATLALGRVDGAFIMSGGQLQLANLSAQGAQADLALNATVDLARRLLDARLTLTGRAQSAGGAGRPEIDVAVKGPLGAPSRSIDVAKLLGWVTLRAVEVQARRLDAAEAQRRATEQALQRAEEAARQRAEAEREAKREAERRAREAAPPPADNATTIREENVPAVRPGGSAAGSVPTPSARPASPPAAASQPAAAPAESAPALPPPVDIRPTSTPRRAAPPPHPQSAPPPLPPPQREPNVFERLFGLGR